MTPRFHNECQRLHAKVRRMVYLWEALMEYEEARETDGLGRFRTDRRPVRCAGMWGTLVYAVVAALYTQGLCYLAVTQPIMLRLSIWLGVGIYGMLFFQWNDQAYGKLFIPLWIAFIAALSAMTVLEYLFLAMGLLLWIRSGQRSCESGFWFRFGGDLLLSYGGLEMALWFSNSTSVAPVWATFIFCILQGFYFFPKWIRDFSIRKSINNRSAFPDIL